MVRKMDNEQKCPRCRCLMKKIPVRRLDSTLIIEFYCDKCDESITFYPDLDIVKSERANYF